MDANIVHFGVDGALGGAAPGFFGVGMAVEQPDEVDRVQAGDVRAARVAGAAAEAGAELASLTPKRDLRTCHIHSAWALHRIERSIAAALDDLVERRRAGGVGQWMTGLLSQSLRVMLTTAAHIGGCVAGLAMQRPLLLWHYRRA